MAKKLSLTITKIGGQTLPTSTSRMFDVDDIVYGIAFGSGSIIVHPDKDGSLQSFQVTQSVSQIVGSANSGDTKLISLTVNKIGGNTVSPAAAQIFNINKMIYGVDFGSGAVVSHPNSKGEYESHYVNQSIDDIQSLIAANQYMPISVSQDGNNVASTSLSSWELTANDHLWFTCDADIIFDTDNIVQFTSTDTGSFDFTLDANNGVNIDSIHAISLHSDVLIEIDAPCLFTSQSPNPGDIIDGMFWFDGTDFKAQVAGVVKTFTLT